MGQFQLSCLVVCLPLTPVVLWTHTSRQALMSEGFFLKHNPLSMTVCFTWFHQTLSARTTLQRRKKTAFSRSQHFSCRFLLGGNHWKSCPTQFTEALGPAYRNRRTGLLVSANKMLGRIYRSFWQLMLGSELLWHRRSARTSAWHQLVSEIYRNTRTAGITVKYAPFYSSH